MGLGGFHERACFVATQAAEEAVTALHLRCRQEARGQAVARPLHELPSEATVPSELVEKARTLDAFYIPPRYSNSHPERPPFEHYGPLQSTEALAYAREAVGFVRAQMA